MAAMKASDYGKLIKKSLIDRDMTQVELADMLGINKTYLTKILTGDRTGAKYRKAISEILGINHESAA